MVALDLLVYQLSNWKFWAPQKGCGQRVFGHVVAYSFAAYGVLVCPCLCARGHFYLLLRNFAFVRQDVYCFRWSTTCCSLEHSKTRCVAACASARLVRSCTIWFSSLSVSACVSLFYLCVCRCVPICVCRCVPICVCRCVPILFLSVSAGVSLFYPCLCLQVCPYPLCVSMYVPTLWGNPKKVAETMVATAKNTLL